MILVGNGRLAKLDFSSSHALVVDWIIQRDVGLQLLIDER